MGDVGAELPANLIVGIEELDGAVLDGKHPGAEGTGVVVAADGLPVPEARVLAAVSGLDAGAAACDAHGVEGWGPHGRDDGGGDDELRHGDGNDLHGRWL